MRRGTDAWEKPPGRQAQRPRVLAVYLASDASDFVTGQTIFIEGGALSHV